MEVAPGEQFDLSQISMHGLDDARLRSPDLENLEWAPDGKPEYQKLLSKLQGDLNALQYFQRHFDNALQSVENHRKVNERAAVVIVGQIQVPGRELDGSRVEAQMQMAQGGYFCDYARPGLPVGFRLHGYDPLDYVPKGSHDGVEYCGVLRMKKTAPRDTASVHGSIVIEGEQIPSDLRVYSTEDIFNINSLSWGYQGSRGNPNQSQPTVQGNEFHFSKLSPISYTIGVSGSSIVDQSRHIRFEPGESRTMPPFILFRTRNIRMKYLASKTGNFVGAITRTSVIDTDSGHWRSFDDPAEYKNLGWDFGLEQYGDGVVAKPSYNPCYMADLGERTLEECCFLDVNATMAGNVGNFDRYLLEQGHVYLLKQWYWQHWVLFKVDGITLAPLNGK